MHHRLAQVLRLDASGGVALGDAVGRAVLIEHTGVID